MSPQNQDQHRIPQVYLKKFGYLTPNDQWKVTVNKRGERFTRQKSIESFTIATNIYDIESEDPKIHRIFEELNGDIENEFNSIISDLENSGILTEKSYAMVLQMVANLICRSDYWREWILGILNHKNKKNFLTCIVAHNSKNYEELKTILEKPHYKILVDLTPEKAINRVLLYLLDYLWLRLQHYEIVILESQEGKPWFTSDEPIVLHNRTGKWEFLAKESEIYFPISPKYLLYLHFNGSSNKKNKLRLYNSNQIYQATNSQNVGFQRMIMKNANQYVIVAGEFKYKNGVVTK